MRKFQLSCLKLREVVNSHRLGPLSSDPEDNLETLTLGHFPIVHHPSSIPQPSMTNSNMNSEIHWKLVQHFRDQFQELWSREQRTLCNKRYKRYIILNSSTVMGL